MFPRVDVSKDWLDLGWQDKLERIANTGQAITAWLDRMDPGLVGCEPTGGYERALLTALRQRGIPFLRVHKTDRIDARLILAFLGDLLARQELRPVLRVLRVMMGCASWRCAGGS